MSQKRVIKEDEVLINEVNICMRVYQPPQTSQIHTIGDVEEGEARSRVKCSGNLRAETLHVVVGLNGFLYGSIFTRQPAPIFHAAVQAWIQLHNRGAGMEVKI